MRYLLTLSVVFFVLMAPAQQPLRLLFYNVENLFDTIDHPTKFDEEFTPKGKNNHTGDRFYQKCSNLAKVIDSSFAGAEPAIVGLCEVENQWVVEELRNHISIPHHLGVLHFESPDQRGIDNAMLYDTARFTLSHSGNATIDLGPEERPTRGIVWAVMVENSTNAHFVFLVNHWPSRSGGQEQSEWKRGRAAERAVVLLDSLRTAHPKAGMVLMGDLNDHPTDASVMILEECASPSSDPCLVNMHKQFVGTDAGSHAYRGEWGVLDQMLVNQLLLNQSSGWTTSPSDATFVKKPWMLYKSEQDGGYFPSRSYGGSKYFGGYSDHLPAALVIRFQQ